MGNIINGGTPKGQSDGYDLAILEKLQTTKDNSNKTMLSFIMKTLVDEQGPEIIDVFASENKAFATKATDCTALITKTKEIEMRLGMTQGCHDSICQSGEESDHFSETTGRELKEIRTDSDLYKEQT